MEIREYRSEDLAYLIELFLDTVYSVNIKDYTEEQIQAWTNHIRGDCSRTELVILKKQLKEKFSKNLTENYSLIAVENGVIVGFSDLSSEGLLNMFYVHKDYQGRGIGKALLNKIFTYAKHQNISVITTESSITAKSFFEKNGFQCVTAQTRNIGEIGLTNYIMKIDLTKD